MESDIWGSAKEISCAQIMNVPSTLERRSKTNLTSLQLDKRNFVSHARL